MFPFPVPFTSLRCSTWIIFLIATVFSSHLSHGSQLQSNGENQLNQGTETKIIGQSVDDFDKNPQIPQTDKTVSVREEVSEEDDDDMSEIEPTIRLSSTSTLSSVETTTVTVPDKLTPSSDYEYDDNEDSSSEEKKMPTFSVVTTQSSDSETLEQLQAQSISASEKNVVTTPAIQVPTSSRVPDYDPNYSVNPPLEFTTSWPSSFQYLPVPDPVPPPPLSTQPIPPSTTSEYDQVLKLPEVHGLDKNENIMNEHDTLSPPLNHELMASLPMPPQLSKPNLDDIPWPFNEESHDPEEVPNLKIEKIRVGEICGNRMGQVLENCGTHAICQEVDSSSDLKCVCQLNFEINADSRTDCVEIEKVEMEENLQISTKGEEMRTEVDIIIKQDHQNINVIAPRPITPLDRNSILELGSIRKNLPKEFLLRVGESCVPLTSAELQGIETNNFISNPELGGGHIPCVRDAECITVQSLWQMFSICQCKEGYYKTARGKCTNYSQIDNRNVPSSASYNGGETFNWKLRWWLLFQLTLIYQICNLFL